MLKNYMIDILIMMLKIIGSHKKLLYAITKTVYKITITFRINFARIQQFEN